MLFEVRDEARIKLGKTHKFGNVADQFGGRPVMEQGMLGHGGAVVVR